MCRSLARSNSAAAGTREPPAQKPPGDRETEDEATGLRDDGRSGRARNAPVQREHQHHRQHHAHDIDGHLNGEGKYGARLSDQPAEDHVVGEHQRRGPDSNGEVGLRGARHAFAAAHHAEQNVRKRHLQDDEQRTGHAGKQESAQQQQRKFVPVAGALRLRGEGNGSHAQEAEQPEQAVEDHRGHRHAAEQRSIAEPADRRRGHHAEQRRGKVREHRGAGDGEDVARMRRPCCGRRRRFVRWHLQRQSSMVIPSLAAV